MPTERQSESARINGAKSHGPKSAEGKKKSSRNALRHGCTAGHTILLACEDRGDFNRMRKDYDAMYKPVTMEEENLVDEMFASASRLRRATTIETAHPAWLALPVGETHRRSVSPTKGRALANPTPGIKSLREYPPLRQPGFTIQARPRDFQARKWWYTVGILGDVGIALRIMCHI